MMSVSALYRDIQIDLDELWGCLRHSACMT